MRDEERDERTEKWQVIARIRYADKEERRRAGKSRGGGVEVFMPSSGGASASGGVEGHRAGHSLSNTKNSDKVGQTLKFLCRALPPRYVCTYLIRPKYSQTYLRCR